MIRQTKTNRRFDRDAVLDVLGGVWLVTLLLSLLHLPGMIA
ncbi:MAG: hypothetical protein AAF919_17385 [Pseudomonadota bacterium]